MRSYLGTLTAALALALAVSTPGAAGAAPPPDRLPADWTGVDVGTTQGLRGLAAVDRSTAWVSGSDGGVWLTTNGGASWRDVGPPETTGLLFRDVEASDDRTAQVLAIGEGEASRIYRTTDGGRTWAETFRSSEPAAFYDCMATWPDQRHGIAMSDPVDGRFRIITTADGGATWQVADPAGMPAAVEGEFGFAASGTCLVASGKSDAWLVSGGAASRIFHSRDRGRTWTVSSSPIPASPAGGTFSIAVSGKRQAIAVGGDFESPTVGADASAFFRGQRWIGGGDLSGYRSGVAWLPRSPRAAIAVGPAGSDVTLDGARSWSRFSDLGYDAVECTDDRACWASGSRGRVGVMVLR